MPRFILKEVIKSLVRVPEFKDEGNNITATPLSVTLRQLPDLQVTSLLVPQRATIGQSLNLTYSVTNNGTGEIPASQSQWTDQIYLSRDKYLDPKTDIYLDSIEHTGSLGAGNSYTVNKSVKIPNYLSGPFYAFIVTDTSNKVFEGIGENNNATSSLQPIILEVSPPSDLQVNEIKTGDAGRSGETIKVEWTVSNSGVNPATGEWSDSVYLSKDGVWDINDPLLGRVTVNQTLNPGQSYKSTLDAILPPVIPGGYRLIVRSDIYNQIYEGDTEGNNTSSAATPLNITVDALQLGVPFKTTLTTGQSHLYQLQVTNGQTLQVKLNTANSNSVNELFLRSGDVPTGTLYDATSTGALVANPSALIPTTKAGTYYILVRNDVGSGEVTLQANLLPFGITDVITDKGGDGRYVTTDITGAQFKSGALVKLIRPGIAEYEPVRYQVVDSTKITAMFDLKGAPHGLYDVKVINPDGQEAIVPYRYLVEKAIEPDVTLGLGGTRVLSPGETGTYGVNLQSLTNLDTPYVYFQFGLPALGNNQFLFSQFKPEVTSSLGLTSLPYVQLTDNLRGQPSTLTDLPWASIASQVNTNGEILAPGYVIDLPTRDSTGRVFNIQTYPGLLDLLAKQPDAFSNLSPGDDGKIAFKFPIIATATALTRNEFISQQTVEALTLREAILKDKTAAVGLTVLAADSNTWVTSYLAALEEAGLLRKENTAPPLRQDPLVISLVATLGTGILVSPAGKSSFTDGNLVNFFTSVRKWYGDTPSLIGNSSIPDAQTYNLGLSQPTHFAAFNLYVPFGKANVDLPNGANVSPISFAQYLQGKASISDLATIKAPTGQGTENFIPVNQALPYTINFTSSTNAGEVRIVTQLDSDLDLKSFRLGDLSLGDIQIHLPSGRGTFQGDFDFRKTKGFILRVSAGIESLSGTATWLLQAIDPTTGEVISDPNKGLLPNNSLSFVSYSVLPNSQVTTGTEITSNARIIYNTTAPLETKSVRNVVDAVAPRTSLTVKSLFEGGSDYLVKWTAVDDANGSGVANVTVYVAEDGGDFTIWKRQTSDTEGVYSGKLGHTYQFVAVGRDLAGNTERPTSSVTLPLADSTVNLGSLPANTQTTEPLVKPTPVNIPGTVPNILFTRASQGIPQEVNSNPSEFTKVLRPFTAQAFATGIPTSGAHIAPMAIVALEDGSVIASGGGNRGSLYHLNKMGQQVGAPLVELPLPIFDLALDGYGSLWGVTGGGPLVKLDRSTGYLMKQYGDGITQSLAIDKQSQLIYVSSGNGIEIFDPSKETFRHFSDLRVGNLSFDLDGSLWGVRWPQRGEIVRFASDGQAESMFTFDLPIDSIAFGTKGTELEGLLFVSSNSGDLLMVDLTTNKSIKVATGGSRGDIIKTTNDGRILLSQSGHIDVLMPQRVPQVAFTNPSTDAIVALPNGSLNVTFDSEMYVGEGTEDFSVLNPANFTLTGGTGNVITPTGVRYDATTKTAVLTFAALNPDHYELKVASKVHSKVGLAMDAAYNVDFTAVSDFSAYVDLKFSNTRSQRGTQTISFDVSLTNKTGYDVQLPLALILDPNKGETGIPLTGSKNDNGYYLIDLSKDLPNGKLQPGQSITTETVTVYNPDALRFDFTPGVYTLPYANKAPSFTSTPITIAKVGQSYSYQVAAIDPDGTTLGYLLYKAPPGMTIDATSGLITWTPTSNSQAQTDVILQVYDSRGGRGSQTFNIDVTGGNHAPVLTSLPTEINGQEGQPLAITVNATDVDGNLLHYGVDNLPNGATFDPVNTTLNWIPGNGAAGTYSNVTFVVSDGKTQVTGTTKILISPINQAPLLTPPLNKTVLEGDVVRIQLQGSDPEGKPVHYFSPLLPSGSRLDPNTGLFEWTPGYSQMGVYSLDFSVTDGDLTTTKTTKITVLNVNAAPVFEAIGVQEVAEGQKLRFRTFALDLDNPGFVLPQRLPNGTLTPLEGTVPSVTYGVSGLPNGALFDAQTAMFSWQPSFEAAGLYTVTFTATDNGNGLTPKTSAGYCTYYCR